MPSLCLHLQTGTELAESLARDMLDGVPRGGPDGTTAPVGEGWGLAPREAREHTYTRSRSQRGIIPPPPPQPAAPPLLVHVPDSELDTLRSGLRAMRLGRVDAALTAASAARRAAGGPASVEALPDGGVSAARDAGEAAVLAASASRLCLDCLASAGVGVQGDG